MDDLTSEQKTIICTLYKEFLKTKINFFSNSDHVQVSFFPNYSPDVIAEICWKLHTKNYLICQKGDDMANSIVISDKTIIYMENKFKNSVKEVAHFISNLL